MYKRQVFNVELPPRYERGLTSTSLLANIFSHWLLYKLVKVSGYYALEVPASSTASVSFTVTLPKLGYVYELNAIFLAIDMGIDPYIGAEITVKNETTGVQETVGKFDAIVYNEAHGGIFKTSLSHFVKDGDTITITINANNIHDTSTWKLRINSIFVEMYYKYRFSTRVPKGLIVKLFKPFKTFDTITIPARSEAEYEYYELDIPLLTGAKIEKVFYCGVIATANGSSLMLRYYDPSTGNYVTGCGAYCVDDYAGQHPIYCVIDVTDYIYDTNKVKVDVYYTNDTLDDLVGYIWSLWLEIWYKGV